MKVSWSELGHAYSIGLEAETMGEAAILVKMAMNHKKVLWDCSLTMYKSGAFRGHLNIGKRAKTPDDCLRITQ